MNKLLILLALITFNAQADNDDLAFDFINVNNGASIDECAESGIFTIQTANKVKNNVQSKYYNIIDHKWPAQAFSSPSIRTKLRSSKVLASFQEFCNLDLIGKFLLLRKSRTNTV